MKQVMAYLVTLMVGFALGAASLSYAAPERDAHWRDNWRTGVYQLCRALKETQEEAERSNNAFFVHKITRCGLRGWVYGRGG
jgi:hypothetical protein